MDAYFQAKGEAKEGGEGAPEEGAGEGEEAVAADAAEVVAD